MRSNLRTLNSTTLSCIEDCSTCFVYRSIKILKNERFRYLIFKEFFSSNSLKNTTRSFLFQTRRNKIKLKIKIIILFFVNETRLLFTNEIKLFFANELLLVSEIRLLLKSRIKLFFASELLFVSN